MQSLKYINGQEKKKGGGFSFGGSLDDDTINSVSYTAAEAAEQQQHAVIPEDAAAQSCSSSSVVQGRNENNLYSRPIVVGYAFGPKKMSTMGVVMAEASKAKLSTSYYNSMTMAPPADDSVTPNHNHDFLTESSLCRHHQEGDGGEDDAEESSSSAYYNHHQVSRNNSPASNNHSNIVFTIDRDGDHDGSLSNIVRHFRSSCSSIAGGSVSTGIYTACSSTAPSTVTLLSGTANMASSSGGDSGSVHSNKLVPVRVSFVPLDPDIPIEEQHGGKMDVILHKLTEDILCVSQMATAATTTTTESNSKAVTEQQQEAALRRVNRLLDFQRDHPECSLIDSPLSVQTLMSRADIANTLRTCLRNVKTASGIPVGSPAYAVVQTVADVEEQIRQTGLSFPIIVKPLVAAGTKASHAMAVVMDPSALPSVMVDKAPCLCQEYSNHDAVLYKVYVLGDHVTVHKRRSLPNLPRNKTSTRSFVEFDSQRPYPRLVDFGFEQDDVVQPSVRKRRRCQTDSSSSSSSSAANKLLPSVDEVKPIVEALKKAFGLELFGFDILITPGEHQIDLIDADDGSPSDHVDDDNNGTWRRRMLVVDVNYFPSYKEVSNFPRLLAKYLTDRAIESRRRATATVPINNATPLK